MIPLRTTVFYGVRLLWLLLRRPEAVVERGENRRWRPFFEGNETGGPLKWEAGRDLDYGPEGVFDDQGFGVECRFLERFKVLAGARVA